MVFRSKFVAQVHIQRLISMKHKIVLIFCKILLFMYCFTVISRFIYIWSKIGQNKNILCQCSYFRFNDVGIPLVWNFYCKFREGVQKTDILRSGWPQGKMSKFWSIFHWNSILWYSKHIFSLWRVSIMHFSCPSRGCK